MLHPRPAIPLVREIGGLLLLVSALSFPIALSLRVHFFGDPRETVSAIFVGCLPAVSFLIASQALSALPGRILFRLRGGPAKQIHSDWLNARLARIAKDLSVWRKLIGEKEIETDLTLMLSGLSKAAVPINIEPLCPGCGIYPQIWPRTTFTETTGITEYIIDQVLDGETDPRLLETHVARPFFWTRILPRQHLLTHPDVRIPRSAELSRHDEIAAARRLMARGLLPSQ